MKTKYILLLIFLLACSWAKAQDIPEKPYYYYKGNKVFLAVDYSRILVVSKNKYVKGDKIQHQQKHFLLKTAMSLIRENMQNIYRFRKV
jgi:hypothetical protein